MAAFPIALTQAQDRGTVAGTCNVNGTAVSRISGDEFTDIVCGFIEIGGSAQQPGALYPIDSITDAGHLVLGISAGLQAGVYFTAATEIRAAHLNALEAKVGITGSEDPDSLENRLVHHEDVLVGGAYLTFTAYANAAALAAAKGYGTWELVSQGQMLAGFKAGDPDFGTAGATGGSKTKNMAHSHPTPALPHSFGEPHGFPPGSEAGVASHPAGNTGSGGSATQDVLNPFCVVYVWKRTA